MKRLIRWISIICLILFFCMGLTVGLLYISGYELKNIYKAISVDNHQDLEQKKEPILVDAQVRFQDAVKLDNGNYSLKNSQFNEKRKWEEKEVQKVIHEMSHQKIGAEEKSGFLLITQERIKSLHNIVNNHKFISEVAYKEILRNWEKGDYSNAVSQHNKVWSLQYGQIGEALTILSPEEELAYINSTLTSSLTYSGNSIVGWSKKQNPEIN
ncbi:hypothetical protein HAU06_06945 [Bacillus toyonensis]|uniref:DUF6241 domain-containing protein n=1 Tax=Bacillus toyonensis TaxID=155322 RepID=UPI00163A1313|nr:DUF6241 domain-containing protein [Bacillus toyonensis]MBC2683897.1 hypothetical protein [Bacillus toyonensis]MCU5305330.1 DUF6241 domain-containing protein [Bacillus toyonensis]